MPIELMQVVTPADEAVDLWLDVDAALAIGLAEDKANSAIYEVLAALKIEGEDEVDPGNMTTVRVSLDTENLELFLEPGALEDLEASADAVLVDETATEVAETVTEEEEPADEEEPAGEIDLATYIAEMVAWFPEAFDGWVYNFSDPAQTLARQVAIGDVTDVSNQRDDPPSWDARAPLSDPASGQAFGTFLVTFMVQDDVPYAYLDGDTFAEVNKAMLAEPVVEPVAEPIVEPVAEGNGLPSKKAAAALLQAAIGSDDTRQELFYRIGESSAIDDYDIYLLDSDTILGKIGDELSDARGWWISPKLRLAPAEGDDEPLDINITAAKLLVTADNATAWIELSSDDV